jgi:hypothetical protein
MEDIKEKYERIFENKKLKILSFYSLKIKLIKSLSPFD